jgi:hypothetical protein
LAVGPSAVGTRWAGSCGKKRGHHDDPFSAPVLSGPSHGRFMKRQRSLVSRTRSLIVSICAISLSLVAGLSLLLTWQEGTIISIVWCEENLRNSTWITYEIHFTSQSGGVFIVARSDVIPDRRKEARNRLEIALGPSGSGYPERHWMHGACGFEAGMLEVGDVAIDKVSRQQSQQLVGITFPHVFVIVVGLSVASWCGRVRKPRNGSEAIDRKVK